MIRDITIENYRLFEKFHMEGLNQVNLLVGTNNSGKSSLLEAIYLLVNNEDPGALLEVLRNRGQFVNEASYFVDGSPSDEVLFLLADVFKGHTLQEDQNIAIKSQKDERMSLEYKFVDYGMSWPGKIADRTYEEIGVGLIFRGEKEPEVLNFFHFEDNNTSLSSGYSGPRRIDKSKINKYFVTTERLSQQATSRLWNRVILTTKEDMVLESLRILEPRIERIAITNQGTLQMGILLKINGQDRPVSLGSMGDGMYRIFALALSLVNCENGALFVDEIDTGLHHKALTKMWRLVIETAKRLNIQVFATTHSWDCLASFHKALNETEETDLGSVFRLERKNGQIDYVAYTGEELAVAVKHDIEMR